MGDQLAWIIHSNVMIMKRLFINEFIDYNDVLKQKAD